jgi:ketosteroid isomerase-like protein
MSQEDVEIVLDQFAATNERDFARAMSHYADDVELIVPANSSFPEVGTFRGREAVGRWFGEWFRHFQPDYRFEIEEARDLGDAVLIVASHEGRGRTSGVEVHGRNAYLYRVRNGKVARVEFHVDRDDAVRSVGSSE